MKLYNKFDYAVAAYLSANELMRLCKDLCEVECSRMAAFLWLRGTNPRKETYAQVEPLLDAIKLAVEAGSLPLPITTKRVDRYNTLKTIISEKLGQQ